MHNNVIIRDFTALDVFGINLRKEQESLNLVIQDKLEYGKILEGVLMCKTVLTHEGQPILIAGMIRINHVVCEGFMMVGREFPDVFKTNGKTILKAIKKAIAEVDCHRLQILVSEDFPIGQRFAEALGFEKEGLCRGIAVDKTNMFIYGKLNV